MTEPQPIVFKLDKPGSRIHIFHWCEEKSCGLAPHIDNCPQCFGFGFVCGGRIINSSMAAEWGDKTYAPCSLCLGSPIKQDRENFYYRWHIAMERHKMNESDNKPDSSRPGVSFTES